MENWKTIPDNEVVLIWKSYNCGCGKTVEVPPTFFEENGTPLCDCGEDMVYDRTEIKIMENWKTIPDDKVCLVWKSGDCGCGKTAEVPPTFFEENGTPLCDCGDDMVYVRTEIKIKE